MHTSAEVCHELKRAYHGCLFAINTSIFTQVYRLTRQYLGFRYENLSISGQLRGLLTWVRCHHGCVREEALRPTVLKGLYGVNTAIRLQRPDTGLTDRTHGDLSFFLASPASPALPAGLPPRMISNTRYPPYSTVPSMDPLIRILDFSVARIALVMQPPRRYCPAVVTLGSVTPSGSSGYPDHDFSCMGTMAPTSFLTVLPPRASIFGLQSHRQRSRTGTAAKSPLPKNGR